MDTRGYYKLVVKTAWDSARRSIGLNAGTVLTILSSLVVGSLLYLGLRGVGGMLQETTTFVAYTLAPFFLLVGAYLVVHIIAAPAKMHYELKKFADKFTWNDIDIAIKRFPADSIFTYGIEVVNNKPFVINHVYGQITWHKIGDYEHPSQSPHKLPWINGREYVWGDAVIDKNGGRQVLSLYNVVRLEKETDWVTYYEADACVPASGQPRERKGAIGSFIESEGVATTEIEFGCTVEDLPLLPPTVKKVYKAWGQNGELRVEEISNSEA